MGTMEFLDRLQTENRWSVFFDSFVGHCDEEEEGFAPWSGYFTMPLCGGGYNYHMRMTGRKENGRRPVLRHNLGNGEIHAATGHFNDIDGVLSGVYSRSKQILSGEYNTYRKIFADLCGNQTLLCRSEQLGVEIDFYLTNEGFLFYLKRGEKVTDATPVLFPLFFLRRPSVVVFGRKLVTDAGTRFNIALLREGYRVFLDDGLLEELKQIIINPKGLHV